MKRLIALLLCAVICVGFLVACKKDGGEPEETTTAPAPEETPVEETVSPWDSFVATPNPTDVASGTFETLTADYRSTGQYKKYCISSTRNSVRLDVLAPVFSIDGIIHPEQNEGLYARFDKTTRDYFATNFPTAEIVLRETNTAGVTVRFRTNADAITLHATVKNIQKGFPHLTGRGAYGFDVYVGTGSDRTYCGGKMQMLVPTNLVPDDPTYPQFYTGTFANPKNQSRIELPEGYKEVMIEFPQYAGVEELAIEFNTGTKIAPPLERMGGNICFYGSSITQGACATRAGTSYTNIVSRMFDANCINLGFSSGAYGEQIVAEFIASRKEITAFVMDYDHNTSEVRLGETHYPFYKTVREGLPDIPIVFVSRPIFTTEPTEEDLARLGHIKATYERAIAEGDKNVYLVDGTKFFPDMNHDIYSIDMTHPNDIGFLHMAEAVYNALAPAMMKKD